MVYSGLFLALSHYFMPISSKTRWTAASKIWALDGADALRWALEDDFLAMVFGKFTRCIRLLGYCRRLNF
jgi:hypothetical protein